MAKIIIPTPLRKFTDSLPSVEVNGDTVLLAIQNLSNTYPELKKYLLEEDGSFKGFVKVFVEEDDINSLDNEQTKVAQNNTISIIPAIAGGSTN